MEALAEYYLVVTAFQVAAAVAFWRSGYGNAIGRTMGTTLIAVNASVSLDAALATWWPDRWTLRATGALDAATPEIIMAFALWFPRQRLSGWRATALALVLAVWALVAMVTGAVQESTPALWDQVVLSVPVMLSYAFAALIFANALRREPGWVPLFLLSAFLLRGADFGARFSRVGEEFVGIAGAVLAVAIVVAVALALRAQLAPAAKAVVLGAAGAGALLGLVDPVGPAGWLPENLLTLSIGRPALMTLAVLSPGAAALFFRGAGVGLLAYVGAAILVRAIGLDDGVGSLLIATGVTAAVVSTWAFLQLRAAPSAARRPDAERLVEELARLPRGTWIARADLANRLQILRRNVHRAAEAANRTSGARPGQPIILWTLRRGRGNQLQYHYKLADE